MELLTGKKDDNKMKAYGRVQAGGLGWGWGWEWGCEMPVSAASSSSSQPDAQAQALLSIEDPTERKTSLADRKQQAVKLRTQLQTMRSEMATKKSADSFLKGKKLELLLQKLKEEREARLAAQEAFEIIDPEIQEVRERLNAALFEQKQLAEKYPAHCAKTAEVLMFLAKLAVKTQGTETTIKCRGIKSILELVITFKQCELQELRQEVAKAQAELEKLKQDNERFVNSLMALSEKGYKEDHAERHDALAESAAGIKQGNLQMVRDLPKEHTPAPNAKGSQSLALADSSGNVPGNSRSSDSLAVRDKGVLESPMPWLPSFPWDGRAQGLDVQGSGFPQGNSPVPWLPPFGWAGQAMPQSSSSVAPVTEKVSQVVVSEVVEDLEEIEDISEEDS
eukprot:gnl/MRDRNA2_/MRDRNA2_119668_c0_seq1.p1 gnl/MRDRNA2_/MRDRNA2_119668_c0~~gnl/MRDRNA2_/MRDRNA2_119668_c0_seq1.p1  ORF type:complete len:393 (+),score=102.11 gnl/MRDRNA2_/MRDRNA2_119668_c0_seq1:78-1256(+)